MQCGPGPEDHYSMNSDLAYSARLLDKLSGPVPCRAHAACLRRRIFSFFSQSLVRSERRFRPGERARVRY